MIADIAEEMERRNRIALDFAKEEALRSVDSAKPAEARRYAVSARRSLVIARTWEEAIKIVTGMKA